MADTKQATAETVCEHCGLTLRMFLGSWVSDVGSSTSVFCPERTSRMSPLPHVPRTQPSQTELRIPDDLKGDYEYAKSHNSKRAFYGWEIVELIERIARLEGKR